VQGLQMLDPSRPLVRSSTIHRLPDELRASQPLFEQQAYP